MEISVIVPFRNSARHLRACLEALLQQELTAGNYEVIAIDNNSTDGSPTIARGFPAVRLLSETRQSAYAARNLGLGMARGRLIAFTDADCTPRRDWLRRLSDAMADPRTMLVMGRDLPAGRSLSVRLLGEYDHVKEDFVMTSTDPTIYYGHTNNLIGRRELFDRLGGFDERPRGADVIFVRRTLALYGTEAVRYEPRAIVDHLEIDSPRVYFRKAFLYGQSGRRNSHEIPIRPLRKTERLRVFRETLRAGRLSLSEAGLLLGLLGIGVGCFQLGWLSVPARSLPGRTVPPGSPSTLAT